MFSFTYTEKATRIVLNLQIKAATMGNKYGIQISCFNYLDLFFILTAFH